MLDKENGDSALEDQDFSPRKRACSARPRFGSIADEPGQVEFKKNTTLGNLLSTLRPVKEQSEALQDEVVDVMFEPSFDSSAG